MVTFAQIGFCICCIIVLSLIKERNWNKTPCIVNSNHKMRNSRKNPIVKILLAIIGIPLSIIGILIILLYIPSVQQYAIESICQKIYQSSGFTIAAADARLAFPLKLKIDDFVFSKGDTVYAKSERINLNISPWPLLSGEIELNYIELENTSIETQELLPEVAIEGEIAFFRAVARNIDLAHGNANIRQLHIDGTRLNITLTDTLPDNEKSKAPADWTIALRRGAISNSSIGIQIPQDTLSTKIEIGKANIENLVADIAAQSYMAELLTLKESKARYDKGNYSKEERPLEHIALEKIAFDLSGIEITPAVAKLSINSMALAQPHGVVLTESKGVICCNTASLTLSDFTLHSKSGSSLKATCNIPLSALKSSKPLDIDAELDASLNKSDLVALLTAEQYNNLAIFQEKMFATKIKAHGNCSKINIDTIGVSMPELASFGVKGELRNINNRKKFTAKAIIDGYANDLKGVIAQAQGDTIHSATDNNASAWLKGTLEYNTGIANADITLHAADGGIVANAQYDITKERYDAKVTTDSINIARIVPNVPIEHLSMSLLADGRGFDIFADSTAYRLALKVDSICYNSISAGSIEVNASQANLISRMTALGNDPNLQFAIEADTRLHGNSIDNTTDIKVEKADLGKMNITDANLATELHMNLGLSTDLGEKHAIKLYGDALKIYTDTKTFTPKDISVEFYTAPDSTSLHADNGDLHVLGAMESGYRGLLKSLSKTGDMFMEALKHENMVHFMQDYQRLLPELHFAFKCGQDNMLANFLAIKGMRASSMRMDIDMDTISGLNIQGGVYGFKKGDINLDTIRVLTRQEGNRLRYYAGVRSTALDPQNHKQSYNAMLYGNLANDSLTTHFVFRDKGEAVGAKLGATTILKPYGLDISFAPKAVLLAEEFHFGDGNHISIGKGLSVNAELTLSDSHGSGIHLQATPDGDNGQNASMTLFNINLQKLTGVIPYAPEMAGTLDLDLNIRKESKGMLLSADMRAEELSYEGVYIGNEVIEAVYFPRKDNTHYLDLMLFHEDEEVAHLSGNYDNNSDGNLDGSITLTRFPLAVSKAFLQDAGVALQGFISGNMSAQGMLARLTTNGHIQFESVDIDAYRLGASLHVPDATTRIIDNRLQFKEFNIFAAGDTPFGINGEIDFSRLLDPTFNLRMKADSYKLIDSPRRKGAMLYGKLFVDVKAMVGGSLSKMRFHGDVAMKSKSNITYVMTETPIESDKELDGLVEFVNFNDTTTITATRKDIDLGNINLNLNLRIDDGARINADLNEGRSNYVTTEGNGNMQLTYSSEAGINVTGHYTMNDGEFKLTLPVIPLKTLAISDGSEIRWSGELLNPALNITALERVTSSVTFDDNSTQPVPFDVGVKVSNTLEQMGLSFVMSSPENPIVQEQLNALDTEGMNRYAVTMLLTGTYAGNRSMSASNALSSFIDAKINSIAGSAMQSINVNVGINDATNAKTGDTYKNYSFSFSKRFWNDRVTLMVGGEVNSGNAPEGSNSFINNASIEWKLSENSNRYLKIFYDKNYQSILEGEITETGIGYVYKRKLNRLKELFIFRNARKEEKKEKE